MLTTDWLWRSESPVKHWVRIYSLSLFVTAQFLLTFHASSILFSGIWPIWIGQQSIHFPAAQFLTHWKKKSTPPIISLSASAAHHTCGTLSRPLKHYDMEKITLCFNLSTKEQSNYRAKQSPGRPNKEKSKKIWWKFLRGLPMFNHASGLN